MPPESFLDAYISWVREHMEGSEFDKWWMLLNTPPPRAKPSARAVAAEGENFMAFYGAVTGHDPRAGRT